MARNQTTEHTASAETSVLPVIPEWIVKPAYDRSQVLASVVHFGLGGFHRSHEAAYLDHCRRFALAA